MIARILVGLALPAAAFAQAHAAIEEIVVTAPQTRDRVSPPSLVLDNEALQEIQPVATADVFRNLTGVSLRTNSRGESVVRCGFAADRPSRTVAFDGRSSKSTGWLTAPTNGRCCQDCVFLAADPRTK